MIGKIKWLALGGLLLLAGCHRAQKQPVDTLPTEAPMEVTDTAPVPTADSIVAVQPRPATQTLQLDTAETTQLRLFARKQKTIYSPAQLTGEWHRGNEHEHYLADGTGQRWDTGDDVYRTEAQTFHWTMDSNLLTLRYEMTLGALVARQYVVTFIDDETLVYRDAYGGFFMWDRVPADFTDHP